jgi:hypothetical protein
MMSKYTVPVNQSVGPMVVLREFRVICIALFSGSARFLATVTTPREAFVLMKCIPAWLYVGLEGISDCLHGSLNN